MHRYNDGLCDGGRAESLFPLFGRFQSSPPPAVRFESCVAIGQRYFCPWIMLQSGTKEVNLVLNRERGSYKTTESPIDLSGFPSSANSRIGVTLAIFLTNDNRRISRAEVKRKMRSKSSMGIHSIRD